MPRFHLNVICETVAHDEEGIERSSLEDAKKDAVIGVRELVADDIRNGRPIHAYYRIEIADPTGGVLDAVCFRDVVEIRE